MDTNLFLEWLMTHKGMGTRSAKDVVSRYKRILKMLGVEEIDRETLGKLEQNGDFQGSSMFVKSQLRRTVALCTEYQSEEN